MDFRDDIIQILKLEEALATLMYHYHELDNLKFNNIILMFLAENPNYVLDLEDNELPHFIDKERYIRTGEYKIAKELTNKILIFNDNGEEKKLEDLILECFYNEKLGYFVKKVTYGEDVREKHYRKLTIFKS